MAETPHGFNYGQHLLEMMGSFWTAAYQDQDLMVSFSKGLGEVLGQKYLNFLEQMLASSLKDIPIFHKERWHLLTFKESETNQNDATVLKFGGSAAFKNQPAVFGPQPAGTEYKEGATFQFGGFASGQYYAYAIPSDLADIDAYIVNRVYDPSLVWSKGTDFQVDKSVIIFYENPFDNVLIPKRNILDEVGNITDREIALWAYNAKFDKENLWTHYGYLFDVKLDSSENYRDFLRAAMGIFMVGPRFNTLTGVLTALFGLPIVKETLEVVEEIQVVGNERIVLTDKNKYTLGASVELNPDVSIGASLPIFTPLSNTVQILDNVEQPNWWRNRTFIPLPVQILNNEYYGPLVVYNEYATYEVKWNNTFDFQHKGSMTDAQQEYFRNFPMTWNMGWKWNESTARVNFLDYIFSNITKDSLFLLTVNTNDIILERLIGTAFELFNEALPANVFMVALFEHTLETDYETASRIVDTLSEDRGFSLEETIELNTRVQDGHHGIARWNSGLVWGPPATWKWNSVAFQPNIAILKRFFKCQI